MLLATEIPNARSTAGFVRTIRYAPSVKPLGKAINPEVIFAGVLSEYDRMYQNAILQANLEKLQSLGYIFIEPEEGWLACGRTGKGCLASTERLLSSIRSVLAGEPIQ